MFNEANIIIIYMLVLIFTFSFSTLLRIYLDASERRKNKRLQGDKSQEILEEIQTRENGCNIDKIIRNLENEDMDITPRYNF